ncbi:MAG TPA: protein kinase [Thermoguttaceae bacterium]|nr:protein kinase [Thermoguttaceae bacterium]
MSTDPTIPQGGPERRQAQQKSVQRSHPPTQVPGYEMERFLGVGAYGEVWVAIDRNTGRRVAIKFYTHRGGLDWSLLSREVEKLAFLFADRYVVQLIGVGWDADPPYYIMEYLEQGSLAQRLDSGPLPVPEAVDVFRDVAVGLVHAHGKGVLHCDLKPANILLDQDHKPRLADFGQSRLSHEQAPALGTLFYMAPEQADLEAVPDARWDVYALGALLYCMLTGRPPHRDEESVGRLEAAGGLKSRLAQYRRIIRNSPVPTEHRQVPGVDRALAEIIERCLAPDPRRRYPNVQAVLAALDARDANRARRPMTILGGVGPALVLLVVSLFAWTGFSRALQKSGELLTRSALESNEFAARFVARTAGNKLERRFEAVEQVASSEKLREAIRQYEQAVAAPETEALLDRLSTPGLLGDERQQPETYQRLLEEFRKLDARTKLQAEFASLLPERMRPKENARSVEGEKERGTEEVASWFFCDRRGLSTARLPQSETIGRDYTWRSYFHGGARDYPPQWQPAEGEHLDRTKLSAVFRSQAHDQWIVAVACPVYEEPPSGGEFLGVVALTVRVGRFVELEEQDTKFRKFQGPVLVDEREGDHRGMILQHPLVQGLAKLSNGELDEYRVPPDKLPDTQQKGRAYRDPLAELAAKSEDGPRNKLWLAQARPVLVRGEPTGWWVIVQEPYDTHEGTILWTLGGLRSDLLLYGLAALVMVFVVLLGLWGFSIRLLKETSPTRLSLPAGEPTERSTTGGVTPDAPTATHRETPS